MTQFWEYRKSKVDEKVFQQQRFSLLKAHDNKLTCMHRLLSSLISFCRVVGTGGVQQETTLQNEEKIQSINTTSKISQEMITSLLQDSHNT